MDNESQQESSPSSSNTKLFTIVAVVILVVAIGGFFYYQHKQGQHQAVMSASNAISPSSAPSSSIAKDTTEPSGMMMHNSTSSAGTHMGMMPQPTPTLTSQQQTEIASGLSMKTTQKTFHIVGGNFYFTPNEISVNKGDKVTIVMENTGGIHNFVIDEYNVTGQTIKTGDSETLTFTADKAGSFVYYCAVPTHKQHGMWGTLTVK